ncbi:hypothetical protein AKJ50_00775 [candidate division MSBL1 archaeon SCGC-AAA382A13]|uniref:Uncharacterized protein n=1 Tax=candidate division MSBL1 archaeon SCGC-AAA382A13 TaxID=1698279 RepID=A0A133VGD4_9EURY|nr:hypothetical protein AKJ50_00775 [candidate division MSBL1 archaeon SCGC-AAA382A13]
MPEAAFGGKRIEYNVRRSERASRSRIDVDLNGVTVVIPKGMDMDPEEFLHGCFFFSEKVVNCPSVLFLVTTSTVPHLKITLIFL